MKFDNVVNEVCKKKKKQKNLKEDYEVSDFAATSTHDVQGLQKHLGKDKKDKIVRRIIKNPVTYIGDIKI